MKKHLSIIIASGVILLSACGPSAEEKAKIEQARLDSIAAVEKIYQDSMAMVAMQDSLMAKMQQDSIMMADSLAKMKSSKSKSTPKKTEPKKEEPKTVGSGKPSMGSGSSSDTTIGKGKPKMGQPK